MDRWIDGCGCSMMDGCWMRLVDDGCGYWMMDMDGYWILVDGWLVEDGYGWILDMDG